MYDRFGYMKSLLSTRLNFIQNIFIIIRWKIIRPAYSSKASILLPRKTHFDIISTKMKQNNTKQQQQQQLTSNKNSSKQMNKDDNKNKNTEENSGEEKTSMGYRFEFVALSTLEQ